RCAPRRAASPPRSRSPLLPTLPRRWFLDLSSRDLLSDRLFSARFAMSCCFPASSHALRASRCHQPHSWLLAARGSKLVARSTPATTPATAPPSPAQPPKQTPHPPPCSASLD